MDKYEKYKTSNYLKEKIFVGTEESSISKEDKSFIEDVLSKSDFPTHFPVDTTIKTIGLVDSNYECDVYEFIHDNKLYCLKINEDDEDEILKKEIENLKLLDGKPITPIPVLFDQVEYSDSTVNISVTTFELSQSFEDISDKMIVDNCDLLAQNFSFLHEYTEGKKENQSKSFVEKIIEDSTFTNLVPEKILDDVSKQIPNYNQYLFFIEDLKKDIFEDLDALDQTNISLCHTNLKKSRILIRYNFVKFINFQYSDFLDPFFDIAFLMLLTGLSTGEAAQESFLQNYLNFNKNINISYESALEKLNKYKDFCYRLAMLRLSANFIFELSLYKNKRSDRIIKLIKTYESLRPYVEKHNSKYLTHCEDFYYLIQ